MYNTHSEMRLFVHYYVGIFVVVIMYLCLTKPKWHAVTEVIIAFRLCILYILICSIEHKKAAPTQPQFHLSDKTYQ